MESELLQKYPNLKSQRSPAGPRLVWTKENILDGLTKFFDETNRYPTSFEIDANEFLPSSRQIQRSFGGLPKLRKELGLKISNYTKGRVRSDLAKALSKRGSMSERYFEKILVDKFGEYFVHVEKLFITATNHSTKIR